MVKYLESNLITFSLTSQGNLICKVMELLIERDLFGEIDKVKNAIELLKMYEPIALKNHPGGYYVAFSGGKDSLAIAILCIMAGVKFELHNNHTGIDVPELTYYIRKIKKWFKEKHNVELYIHYPKETFFELMIRKLLPPTGRVRYCCEVLKEHGGEGRIVLTGVRWEESSSRAAKRQLLEANAYTNKKVMLMSDNEEMRRQFETCIKKGKHIINPILSWTTEDVWELINMFGAPYCEEYDKEGVDRLGCIGCPKASNQAKELAMYPKYAENYKRAIKKMIQRRKEKGKTFWIDPENDVEAVWNWWVYRIAPPKQIEGQLKLEVEEIEED